MCSLTKVKKIDISEFKIRINKKTIVVGTRGSFHFEGTVLEAVAFLKKINPLKTINGSVLFNCASGFFPKYSGYSWNFKDTKDIKMNDIFKSEVGKERFLRLKHVKNPVVAYDLNSGTPLKVFPDMYCVVLWLHKKKLKPDYRAIISVMKNHRKPNFTQSSMGYIWRFYDEVVNKSDS